MSPKFNLKEFIDPKTPVTKIASLDVVSCLDTQKIEQIIDIMLSGKKYRRLPVVNRNKQLKGIITIIDILSYLTGKGTKSLNARTSSVMEKNVYSIDYNFSIFEVLKTFSKYEKGAYPVLKNGKIAGIISEFDFLKLIKKSVGIKVAEIMERAMIAKEEWPVSDIAKIFCMGGFRRLPVVKNKVLTGIITPHDVCLYLKNSKKLLSAKTDKTEVKRIMEKNVVTISPEKDVYEAVNLMKIKKLGGLPVTEDEELVGIITERDIFNLLK